MTNDYMTFTFATPISLQSSPFSDPQGAATFAAMQWRVAEVGNTYRARVRTQDDTGRWSRKTTGR